MYEALWIPEATPPQLTQEVAKDLQKQIREFEAIEVALGAANQLESNQQKINTYLDELGFDLNSLLDNETWPAWALRLGATLAYLGYEHSNQTTVVDQTFDLSREIAEIQGVPEAYVANMHNDQGLMAVINAALEDRRIKAVDKPGLLQISGVGAGCVRFYMQEALLAA